MDPVMAWEILVILFLVATNGLLSGAEIAVISANRTWLRQQADAGDERARLALELAQNPNRFLPSVQVAVAVLGTLAAALAGATLARLLESAPAGSGREAAAQPGGAMALIVVALGLSSLSIVVGELVPKRLAVHNAGTVACVVARPLNLLARMSRPAVWALSAISDSISALFGASAAPAEKISLQEIRHLIEMGTAEGVVDPVEQKLAMEALQLGDRTVRQIMKPRIDIDAVDVQTPQEELLGVIAMAGFSRLPVYEGDLDHIIGFVHLKDVLRQHYLGWKLELRKLIRAALIVPQTMRLDQLLVLFQEQHNQLAVVVDEFGATRGMVTLEDVIEELVGELLTEHHERVEQLIVRRDERSWLVDGTVSIADLLEKLGRQHLIADAPRHVSSIAGLVIEQLGRIPRVGESVAWHDLRLEVVDVDGQRVDRILVSVGEP